MQSYNVLERPVSTPPVQGATVLNGLIRALLLFLGRYWGVTTHPSDESNKHR